jgi:hypothetical protein
VYVLAIETDLSAEQDYGLKEDEGIFVAKESLRNDSSRPQEHIGSRTGF